MTTATVRALVLVFTLAPIAAIAQQAPPDPFATPYAEVCAVCHGANLEGSAQGTPLAGVPLRHGDSVDQITKNISDGFPQARMPAFSATMDPVKIRRLAMFISEKRAQLCYTDFKIATPPTIPEGTIK